MIGGYESGVAGLAVRGIAPIYDKQGKIFGTIMVGQKVLKESLEAIKGKSGIEIAIYEKNKIMAMTLMQNGENLFGKELDCAEILDQVLEKNERYIGKQKMGNIDYLVVYQPLQDQNGQAIGMIFTGISDQVILSAQKKNITDLLLIGLTVLLLGVLIAYCFSKKIVEPIDELAQVAQKMAKGDLTQKIMQKGKDEIASLGESFNHMSSSLLELVSRAKK